MTAVIDRNLLCEAARTIRICISILCFFVIGLCASCSRQAEAPFVEGAIGVRVSRLAFNNCQCFCVPACIRGIARFGPTESFAMCVSNTAA